MITLYICLILIIDIIINRMMIVNVNYKGVLANYSDLHQLKFTLKKTPPPIQKIIKFVPAYGDKYATMIIFPSGKCRIMGLTKALTTNTVLPFKVNDLKIQSITTIVKYHSSINLIELAQRLPVKSYWFEPEIFPALRLLHFNPICVNIFSSGKVVILGMKCFSERDSLVDNILSIINNDCP